MKLKLISNIPERIIMSISLKNNYVSKSTKRIARNLDIAYSHTINIIKQLEEAKILTKEREGRRVRIELTEKGLKIQEHLNEIKKLL